MSLYIIVCFFFEPLFTTKCRRRRVDGISLLLLPPSQNL